jgi:hypothetical protein
MSVKRIGGRCEKGQEDGLGSTDRWTDGGSEEGKKYRWRCSRRRIHSGCNPSEVAKLRVGKVRAESHFSSLGTLGSGQRGRRC